MNTIVELLREVVADPYELIFISTFVLVFITLLKFFSNTVYKIEEIDKEYISEALVKYEKVFKQICDLDKATEKEKYIELFCDVLQYSSKEFFNKLIRYRTAESDEDKSEEKFEAINDMFLVEYRMLKGKQNWKILNSKDGIILDIVVFLNRYNFFKIGLILLNTFVSFFIFNGLLYCFLYAINLSWIDKYKYVTNLISGLIVFELLLILIDQIFTEIRKELKSKMILLIIQWILIVILGLLYLNVIASSDLSIILTPILMILIILGSMYRFSKKNTNRNTN